MKTLLALLTLGLSPALIAQNPGPAVTAHHSAGVSYYCRNVVIDHTKVGASDSTNFPVLVSGTYSYLATVANGGLVQNANGYDIGFYTDQTRATKLDWETEIYTASTGLVIYHVKIPTVSHTTDTTIAMCYGDPTITTDQSNAPATWSQNYAGVWHLPNGTTLTATNSVTGGAGTLTGLPTATTGQIDGAALFGAHAADVIQTDLTTQVTQRTWSIWIYYTGLGGGSLGRIFEKTVGATTSEMLYIAAGTPNVIRFDRMGSGAPATFLMTVPTPDVWHLLTVAYDSGSITNRPVMYIDGVAQTVSPLGSGTGTPNSNTSPYLIGNNLSTGGTRVWAGSLDEFTIADTLRSADWVTTQYNSENSPSTFYSVSSQTAH